MKLYVKEISSPKETVTISYAGGNSKEYNVEAINGKTISIPDNCEDYSTVTVTGEIKEVTDLDYKMSLSTVESGNLSKKL